jgi:hypothetical protein
MTTELLVNAGIGIGARGTLASDPGTGTTLTWTTGHGARFPAVAAPFVLRLQCEDEWMLVTAHTASADTATVLRGQEGSTNVAHAAGTAVVATLTAAALTDLLTKTTRITRIVTMPRPGRTLYLDPTLPAAVEEQFDLGPVTVQTVTITGTPTGGSFALTALGVALTVPYNSTAAQLQTQLDTVYGRNEAVVTGGALPGTALTVSWEGPTYLSRRVAQMTADSTLLTGGTTPTATVATTQSASQWSYTTDASESSRAVLTLATSKQCFIKAKPQYSFRDSEIMLRMRWPASLHSSSRIKLMARWLGDLNYTYMYKLPAGALTYAIGMANNAAEADWRTISQIDNGAGIWRAKLRRVGRFALGKFWREAAQSAVQTVTIGGSPTGGTFTLTYGGQTATGLAWNETAANVQTALRALSSINGANVTVAGSNGGPYTITFTGTLANVAVTAITGSAAGLTGGTPTLTVAWTTYGSDGFEPDWQIIGEHPLTPNYYDPEIGVNGISALVYTAGVLISEVYITELLPPDDSTAINGDFALLDNTTSQPIGWTGWGTTGTAVAEIVNVAGPDGATRRFAHFFRDTDNANTATIIQKLYLRPRTGRAHWPSTQQEHAGALEIGVTSMATNVLHLTAGGDFLSAVIDLYYNDEKDNGLNNGRADYYAGLGPLGIVGGSDTTFPGSGGAGTWPWRRDLLRIPLPFPGRVYYIGLTLGFHDVDTAGDLWLGDITVRQVA